MIEALGNDFVADNLPSKWKVHLQFSETEVSTSLGSAQDKLF